MKIVKIFCVAVLLSGLSLRSDAQLFKDVMNGADKALKGGKGKGKGGSLSQSEITDGLKQALQIGAKNATGKVSKMNGFFGDAMIKILMPPEAKKVENTLRELGFGRQVDDAILSM